MLMALIVLAAAGSAPAAAQNADDETAIRAVITQLFDGMRTRDTVAMNATFHAEARLYSLGRDGAVEVATPAEFAQSVATAPAGLLLDEVIHDVELRVDGPVATAWTYYDFFVGERFSHCGYNAFQLLNAGGAWRIVAITDSRRREGCRQQRH
jgi:hypothetical protein